MPSLSGFSAAAGTQQTTIFRCIPAITDGVFGCILTGMASPHRIGLYVHVPFCTGACRYCDFYSTTYRPDLCDSFIEALAEEWEVVEDREGLKDVTIGTLYVGGGTPSCLSERQWMHLEKRLFSRLKRDPAIEWTVECNPESFTPSKARLWTSMGVTRLSLGIQSLNDRLLRLMGRRHGAGTARRVLDDSSLGAFHSVSVDMIYGLPGQSLEDVGQCAEELTGHPAVSHLSAYELTLHSHSSFGRHRRLLRLPDEEDILGMAEVVKQECAGRGFDRYEISNYARPGHRCRHNLDCWRRVPYAGLGPAAHSFLPPERRANVSSLEEYIVRVSTSGEAADYVETLNPDDVEREIVLLGLRTSDGIDEKHFERETGMRFCSGKRETALRLLQERNMLIHHGNCWVLTDRGMALADAVATELA